MISILVSGDFVPNNRVYDLLLQRDFKTLWSNVVDIKSDYKILNLECPIITRKDIRPIEKHGPSLKSIPIAIEAIQYAGFNCVTLANNHLKDYDEEGIQDTLSVLDRYEIDYVGGGLSLEDASSILYVDQNDIKFAIVNVCEEEFSIASERNAGANLDEPVNTYYRIKEARSNADYVILIIHGGPEHYNLPTPRMKAQYRFYVDIGADVVINHHQHCFSGYELYNGKPIFYGLGNLSFDSKLRDSIWNTGYMVNLLFSRTEIKFEILPYTQGDEKLRLCQNRRNNHPLFAQSRV